MRTSSIAWSLIGLGAPLLAALFSMPPLLRLLGAEGFGLLSLAWALTALSGLFDLGLGRATTRWMAEQKVGGSHERMRETLRTAVRSTWISGAVGGLLVLSLTVLDLPSLLKLQSNSAAEVRWALAVLALCVPVQAVIATYRGACEGLQQFRGVSLARMALGCANFLLPWAIAAHATRDISWLVAALLVSRLAALWSFRHLAELSLRPERPAAAGIRDQAPISWRQLIADGSWLSVSALVSPVLVQADRFLIAALVSAGAVSAYSMPFDIITQLLVVVSAVSTVAFPTIAALRKESATLARQAFRRWLLRVTVGMGVLTAVVAWWLPEALALWLGDSLQAPSIAVGRWLCLGVWINAIGSMFYSWLHAHGRYRATALLHLLELPAYLLLLTLLLQSMGVVGAAVAWVARVGLDTLGLGLLAAQAKDPRQS